MKINHGALPLIMGNYARNFGVSLYMYGHQAFTDGKSITIPRLNFDDYDCMEMAYGYVAHECGHIRFSDFNKLKNELNDTVFGILNTLEDVRIEHLQIRDWPGLEKSFNFVIKQLSKVNHSFVFKISKQCDLATLVVCFCSMASRVLCLKQIDAEKNYKYTKKILQNFIGVDGVKYIEEIIYNAHLCKTTDEVLDRAYRIYSLLCKYSSFLDKVSQNMNMLNNVDFEKKKIGDEEIFKIVKYLQSEDSGYMLELFPSIQEIFEKIHSDSSDLSHLTSKELKLLESIKNILKNISKASFENIDWRSINNAHNMPNIEGILADRSYSEETIGDYGSTTPGEPKPADDLELYNSIQKNHGLKQRLANLVKGYEIWKNATYYSGDRIHIKNYAMRKINGTKHIFYRKEIKKALNTHIHLLVDISGSMSNYCSNQKQRRYEIANYVALSLSMSLDGIRHVTNEVVYFPGNTSEYEIIYKPGQKLLARAAYFDQRPKGCTPLAQAIYHALVDMPEINSLQRNIIIVITDGEPDSYQGAKTMMKKAEELGVEVYGIRICDGGSYSDLFKNGVVIDDATELPNAICRLLKNALYYEKAR